mmetsp:Transcript_4255/g.10833  ORF Transcript_4255/g.10833 Transcript_4255/m.10833 type:complete len:252 (-) Transcript_4255:2735-3490(-)
MIAAASSPLQVSNFPRKRNASTLDLNLRPSLGEYQFRSVLLSEGLRRGILRTDQPSGNPSAGSVGMSLSFSLTVGWPVVLIVSTAADCSDIESTSGSFSISLTTLVSAAPFGSVGSSIPFGLFSTLLGSLSSSGSFLASACLVTLFSGLLFSSVSSGESFLVMACSTTQFSNFSYVESTFFSGSALPVASLSAVSFGSDVLDLLSVSSPCSLSSTSSSLPSSSPSSFASSLFFLSRSSFSRSAAAMYSSFA